MSLFRALTLLSAATLALASPVARSTNSTCNVSLSPDAACTIVGVGPSTLVDGECYDVSGGIQSFEFYEPANNYKFVTVFAEPQCGEGQSSARTAEFLGCASVGFTGLSVRYDFKG